MADSKPKAAAKAKPKAKAKVETTEAKTETVIKKFKVKNLTPYPKIDPASGTTFKAYETKECEKTEWVDCQIKAKLFQVV